MQRSKISDRFRSARPGSVLFTSDVSARGVDYPGVTLVLQVGVPSSREQYIHRLGRTGRAGKDGEGVIILAPFEEPFVQKDISDLPVIKQDAKAILANADDAREVIHEAAAKLPRNFVEDAYMSFLGYCKLEHHRILGFYFLPLSYPSLIIILLLYRLISHASP
jgi:ATP-dependent RNA helicase MSS116